MKPSALSYRERSKILRKRLEALSNVVGGVKNDTGKRIVVVKNPESKKRKTLFANPFGTTAQTIIPGGVAVTKQPDVFKVKVRGSVVGFDRTERKALLIFDDEKGALFGKKKTDGSEGFEYEVGEETKLDSFLENVPPTQDEKNNVAAVAIQRWWLMKQKNDVVGGGGNEKRDQLFDGVIRKKPGTSPNQSAQPSGEVVVKTGGKNPFKTAVSAVIGTGSKVAIFGGWTMRRLLNARDSKSKIMPDVDVGLGRKKDEEVTSTGDDDLLNISKDINVSRSGSVSQSDDEEESSLGDDDFCDDLFSSDDESSISSACQSRIDQILKDDSDSKKDVPVRILDQNKKQKNEHDDQKQVKKSDDVVDINAGKEYVPTSDFGKMFAGEMAKQDELLAGKEIYGAKYDDKTLLYAKLAKSKEQEVFQNKLNRAVKKLNDGVLWGSLTTLDKKILVQSYADQTKQDLSKKNDVEIQQNMSDAIIASAKAAVADAAKKVEGQEEKKEKTYEVLEKALSGDNLKDVTVEQLSAMIKGAEESKSK